MSLTTHRDRLVGNAPRWMQGFTITRFLYAIGVHLDFLASQLIYGVQAKFPGKSSYAGLALTGRDRGIRRGIYETDAQYAVRQETYMAKQAKNGSIEGLLNAVRECVQPLVYDALVLVHSSTTGTDRYTMGPSGFFEHVDRVTGDPWDWDGTEKTSRFWLEIVYPEVWYDDGVVWSDSSPQQWDDTFPAAWGTFGVTPDQIQVLQQTIADWTPPHAHHMHTLIRHEATTALPDGTWARHENRDPHRVFIPGVSNVH